MSDGLDLKLLDSLDLPRSDGPDRTARIGQDPTAQIFVIRRCKSAQLIVSFIDLMETPNISQRTGVKWHDLMGQLSRVRNYKERGNVSCLSMWDIWSMPLLHSQAYKYMGAAYKLKFRVCALIYDSVNGIFFIFQIHFKRRSCRFPKAELMSNVCAT